MAYLNAFKFMASMNKEIIACWDTTSYTLVELEESTACVFRTECWYRRSSHNIGTCGHVVTSQKAIICIS